MRVWDPAVRVLHWALAASVAAAWLTTEWFVGWHRAVGYLALGIVVARLGWGFIGPRHARFGQFVRGPAATIRYAALVWRHREPRYVGHNPLGAWMVLALIGCVAGLGLTGWLYTTDRFWGDETVEQIHRGLAWTIAVLAVLHVGGVVHASVRHHENLIASMAHGNKQEACANDVE